MSSPHEDDHTLPFARALALLGLLLALPLPAQDLPDLHVLRRITLGPSYSCRAPSDVARGYQGTALFLTEYSRLANSPELLFDGACGAPDTFRSHVSGDDNSLLADLGPQTPVEALSAWKAFNLSGLSTPESWTTFRREVPVIPGHSYAALLSDRERRGLLLFQVESHVPNRRVTLKLVVKQYQLLRVDAESPGFSWEAGNLEAPAEVSARQIGSLLVLEKDVLLSAPLERVWSVLCETPSTGPSPAGGPRPLGSARGETVPGGRWELPGLEARRVLSLVPHEQLSLSGSLADSSLVLRLAPEGGGRTRLMATAVGAGEAFQRDRTRQAEALVALIARVVELLAPDRPPPQPVATVPRLLRSATPKPSPAPSSPKRKKAP